MEQKKDTTKKRTWEQITEKERYKIEALYNLGMNAREIAKALQRGKRTIEREIQLGMVEQFLPYRSVTKEKGDGGIQLVYRADTAQLRHDERASNKGRTYKIGKDHKLVAFIEEKIGKEKWSPDVVVAEIRKHPDQHETDICTKTLYNYIDAGLFLGISNKDLLYKKDGKKRTYRPVRTVPLNNRNGKGIEERPKEIEKREEKGHWELDLVVGKQGTKRVILTLVERKSRKSLYVLVQNKSQAAVLRALRRAAKRVKGDFTEVFKTITTDNGSEFLDGKGIKNATGCEEVYYAHPYCSLAASSRVFNTVSFPRIISLCGTNPTSYCIFLYWVYRLLPFSITSAFAFS